MTEMFNDGEGAREWISQKIEAGESGSLAVAFWGSGATEQLKLDKLSDGQEIRIICNLAMGGTNPKEIARLQKIENVDIQQSDRLHGKVYRFDDSALVGSSNVSANGLSFEGGVTKGWHEANLVTSDPQTLNELDLWIQHLGAREITKEDLKHAQEAWNSRRRSALNTPHAADNIHDSLKNNPSFFDDRPVYLVAYRNDEITSEADEVIERAKELYGKKVDWFEDWEDLPKDGILVQFLVKPDGQIHRVDGLRERRPEIKPLPIGKGKKKLLEISFKKVGNRQIKEHVAAIWQPAIAWLMGQKFDEKTGQGWSEDCGFVELSKVAEAIGRGEIVIEA